MSIMKKQQLDFIVIGAQKAATTTIFKYLKEHERVILPEDKEAPFFNMPDLYSNPIKGNDAGITALHYGCIEDRLEMVRLLLESGADVNKASKLGTTPLHVSCMNDRCDIARLLLDKGADLNLVDADGNTALTTACQEGHAVVVLVFVDLICFNMYVLMN